MKAGNKEPMTQPIHPHTRALLRDIAGSLALAAGDDHGFVAFLGLHVELAGGLPPGMIVCARGGTRDPIRRAVKCAGFVAKAEAGAP
jgi:hypothetical protein